MEDDKDDSGVYQCRMGSHLYCADCYFRYWNDSKLKWLLENGGHDYKPTCPECRMPLIRNHWYARARYIEYRIAAKRERERSAAEVQEQLNAAERERTSAEDDHFARLEVEVALAQQQADEAEEKANQIEVAAAIADADRLANANDCAAAVKEAAEVKAHEEEEANQVVKRFQVDRAAQAAGFAKFTKPAPPSHA